METPLEEFPDVEPRPAKDTATHCVAPGCPRPRHRRRLCMAHYTAVYRALTRPLARPRGRTKKSLRGDLVAFTTRVPSDVAAKVEKAAKAKHRTVYLYIADILEGREIWPPQKN